MEHGVRGQSALRVECASGLWTGGSRGGTQIYKYVYIWCLQKYKTIVKAPKAWQPRPKAGPGRKQIRWSKNHTNTELLKSKEKQKRTSLGKHVRGNHRVQMGWVIQKVLGFVKKKYSMIYIASKTDISLLLLSFSVVTRDLSGRRMVFLSFWMFPLLCLQFSVWST